MLKNGLFRQSLSLSILTLLVSSSLTSCSTNTTQSVPNSTASSKPADKNTISENSSPTTIHDDSAKPVPYINPGTGSSDSSSAIAGGIAKRESALSGAPAGAAPMDAEPTVTSEDSSDSASSSDIAILPPTTAAKSLSAGNTDDNEKFSEYLDYLNKYGNSLIDGKDVLKEDISNRFTISVYDKNQKSISDSNIQISYKGNNVFSGKTYSNGKVLFFPNTIKSLNSDCQQQDCNSDNYSVTVQKGNNKITKEFSANDKNWNVELTDNRENSINPTLDIAFLIDATGSMGDEISSVQKTIKGIADKIQNMPSNPKIRYSLVSYKDRVDDYRVKRYDFTSNLDNFQEILNDLSARGGGDYRESMNEGLYNAVDKISWTTDKDAVRLVFLIADAPPHLDYSDDYKYTDSMVDAVKQGIKIYPIAASGLDNSGEYIFRQLAQFTMAKFLFITYGGDEQTPGTTPHHVGEFKENNLDDLVVGIVKDELDNFK